MEVEFLIVPSACGLSLWVPCRLPNLFCAKSKFCFEAKGSSETDGFNPNLEYIINIQLVVPTYVHSESAWGPFEGRHVVTGTALSRDTDAESPPQTAYWHAYHESADRTVHCKGGTKRARQNNMHPKAHNSPLRQHMHTSGFKHASQSAIPCCPLAKMPPYT